MHDAQAHWEQQQLAQAAHLTAIAVSAGSHNNKEAWKILEKQLDHEDAAPEHDVSHLAQVFGKTEAEIRDALAKGWQPPRMTKR